jgi:hypothetical protein
MPPVSHHAAFGLRIASTAPLGPFLPEVAASLRPDVSIETGIPGGPRLDTDLEIEWPDVGRVLVRAGRQVYVRPADGARTEVIAELLSGAVLAIVLEQRGAFVLHASAVAIDGMAVALTGPSGAGKSSAAALFAGAGYDVVADDCLPVTVNGDLVTCMAGPGPLKLCDAAAAHAKTGAADAGLGLDGSRRLCRIRTAESGSSLTLGAVYSLEEGDGHRIVPLHGQRAIVALLRGAFCLPVTGRARRAEQLTRCAQIARRVAVRELRRPLDWQRAGSIVDLVLADLRQEAETTETTSRVFSQQSWENAPEVVPGRVCA